VLLQTTTMSETEPNVFARAAEYVALSNRIKENTVELNGLRKLLKKLDGALLEEMRRDSLNEVTVNGVTIQFTTKLQFKGRFRSEAIDLSLEWNK